MIGFALSPLLALTLGLYLVIDVLRDVRNPLSSAWVNQKLDPKHVLRFIPWQDRWMPLGRSQADQV